MVKFETNNISNPLQKEKIKAIESVERQLNGLGLDLKEVKYPVELVDRIQLNYRVKITNNENRLLGADMTAGKDWFEKISQAYNKDDINLISEFLLKVITEFGARETTKYREIGQKVAALDDVVKGISSGNFKQDRYSELHKEIKEFVDSNHYNFHSPITQYVFRSALNRIEEDCRQAKAKVAVNNNDKKINSTDQSKSKVSTDGENDKKRKGGDNELDNERASKKSRGTAGEKTDFSNLVSEKISQGKEERDKKITDILAGAKNESDPAKLASSLEQLEKENAGNEMEESKKNEIKQLKEKLLASDPQAKQKLINKLKNLLTQNNLSEEDLDQETRKVLEDLNNEEDNEEIIKKEEIVTEQVGLVGAKKKLDKLVERAKGYLKKNLFDKVREVKKEVVHFISDKGYNYKSYLANKSEVDQLFAQAENNSSVKPQEPTWKKSIVPVSLSIGAIALVAGVVIVAKKKKQK